MTIFSYSSSVSIHAPLAGCDLRARTLSAPLCVSIHAPLAGCDADERNLFRIVLVSIHAPLAGCDECHLHCRGVVKCFNPRTPRGVRPLKSISTPLPTVFQSTHPSRGATATPAEVRSFLIVSIHAPLAGCDGKRSHKGNILPRIYGCYSPQIRFFSAVRPTPLLWHGSSTYILSCDFLFTSPSRS